ncbi:MAG: DUF1761 domain-containing protein [Candidatus Diapherotrites archaeon]|nr:DUF1761 domain-containing protein [Candidatus Diapherotrites archaeon]
MSWPIFSSIYGFDTFLKVISVFEISFSRRCMCMGLLVGIGVNYAAVLIAAIASFIVGMIWYGPLFGKKWMKLSGIKKSKKKKKQDMTGIMISGIITDLVVTFVLASFLLMAGASSVIDSIVVAFWIWLGFYVPVMYGGVLWEGKKLELFILNIAYRLTSLFTMAIILAVWV